MQLDGDQRKCRRYVRDSSAYGSPRLKNPSILQVDVYYSNIMLLLYSRHIVARILTPLCLGKSVNLGLLFG